ncbi:MAG TPA: hypothetical protein VKT32_08785 [Chthonomonadaceae bacterium]|nr:hypothetical protein [Chthonomonadaceae bacterium]
MSWLPSRLSFLVPALCMIAWMLKDSGWQWLFDFLRDLWLLRSIGGLLFGLFFLWVRGRYGKRLAARPLSLLAALPYVICGLTALALLQGRIDLAVYATFGLTALYRIWHGRQEEQFNPGAAIIDVALIAAFALNAVWAVVALLALHLFRQTASSGLQEEIRQKPGQMEYVHRAREQCAAGGG